MKKSERYSFVLDWFSRNNPAAGTELSYSNPYELLVAVVLSAQCTDKRVNSVTPALFARFPDPEALSQATAEDIFPYIRSISYPNNKARHLAGLGKILAGTFHSRVPESVADLQTLPGVGRKTANVIASVVFNQPAMAVDTHVFRVSKRLGLVARSLKTPLQVENELCRHIPDELISRAHHWLILHGRYVCLARRPRCTDCGLRPACRFAEQSGLLPEKEAQVT